MGLYLNEMVFAAFFTMDSNCTGKLCDGKEPLI